MSFIEHEEQASDPTTPSAGDVTVYVKSSTKRLASKDDAGTVVDYGDATLTASTPEQIDIGDAGAVGVAADAARSDHEHALPAPAAPADVTKSAASTGSATTVARADHKHDVSTAAPATTGVATTPGEGTASSLARSDHTHQSNTAPADVTKSAAVIGSSGEPARADHKHDASTASAVELTDSANTEGTATSLARSDHTHAHGSRSGGSLHANATGGTAGFMSSTDKTKLDALSTAASVDAKVSARVATTAAGTLASDFEDGDTVDGVVLATGDRILLKNQASGIENGIYVVEASGAPTRSADMPAASSAAGASLFVDEGTANADTGWLCTNNPGSDVVGTDALVFAKFTESTSLATGAPPQIDIGDAGSAGVATDVARSDHEHALPAPAAPVNVTKAAASTGSATTVARADHKHDVTTAAPGTGIGGANSEGTAASLARSDHNHALRTTSGPTDLTIAAITDGQILKRSGTTIVGETRIISRGGTILSPTNGLNVIVWRAPFACTVTNVRGYRVGGTGATINARRNGSSNHLSSALSVSSADTWTDGGAVQNTIYAAGDKLEIMIVTTAGSPTQVAVQVDFTR